MEGYDLEQKAKRRKLIGLDPDLLKKQGASDLRYVIDMYHFNIDDTGLVTYEILSSLFLMPPFQKMLFPYVPSLVIVSLFVRHITKEKISNICRRADVIIYLSQVLEEDVFNRDDDLYDIKHTTELFLIKLSGKFGWNPALINEKFFIDPIVVHTLLDIYLQLLLFSPNEAIYHKKDYDKISDARVYSENRARLNGIIQNFVTGVIHDLSLKTKVPEDDIIKYDFQSENIHDLIMKVRSNTPDTKTEGTTLIAACFALSRQESKETRESPFSLGDIYIKYSIMNWYSGYFARNFEKFKSFLFKWDMRRLRSLRSFTPMMMDIFKQ